MRMIPPLIMRSPVRRIFDALGSNTGVLGIPIERLKSSYSSKLYVAQSSFSFIIIATNIRVTPLVNLMGKNKYTPLNSTTNHSITTKLEDSRSLVARAVCAQDVNMSTVLKEVVDKLAADSSLKYALSSGDWGSKRRAPVSGLVKRLSALKGAPV